MSDTLITKNHGNGAHNVSQTGGLKGASPSPEVHRNEVFVRDEELIFALVEEPETFRMKILRPEIEEDHVEQFMDKTVEWLSTNPEKGCS